MSFHLRLVLAIVKKDIRALLPLIAVACVSFFLQPVIASLDAINTTGDAEFLATVQANFYWVSYLMACLLMICVLQLDPADSLTHDWLARPVPRLHWLLAKLLFMALVIVLPVIAGRLMLYLSQGYDLGLSLAFAAAIEKLPATLVIPMLFAIGLLAPTLRRAILLMALVFFVFLMPAWSVTRPLLEMIGIEMGTEFDSMMWLQAVPIVLAGLAGTVAVFWWLVCRRQPRAATLGFAASVVLVFMAVYPPMWLLDWDKAIAVHRQLINGSGHSGYTTVMEPLQACYPASFIGNTDSRDANPLLVSAGWSESQLRAAGAGGLTMATTVRARAPETACLSSRVAGREIDVDWRVERIRTRATVVAPSLPSPSRLTRSTTADNRFAPIAAVDTDYWLIPETLLQQVASDPSVQLHIDYDLALLSPQAYELPVDGQIHALPALGACRARLDNSANTIEVDCIKRGSQPAMMSAELIGIEASRVDRYYRANFTPALLEALSVRHTRLTLPHPFLADASSILVTAWALEHINSYQQVAPGLLGDGPGICPLPADDNRQLLADASWRDSASHQTRFVSVEPGVRLEVLDWRGSDKPDAPTLLLLPGLGATAHSYDELAAELAQRYNVVAMTRRGTGASAKPDRGYDIARLSQDVLQVINTLGLAQPILVGHSIAGEELSDIGAHHADQVAALIYLDAAFDRVSERDASERKRYRELNAQLPPQPPVRSSETQSYQALTQYALRTQGTDKLPPEGEIMASYDLSTGINRHNSLYLDAIMMGLQAPQYSRITVPALALYAMPGSPEALMEAWYDRSDRGIRETVQALYQMDVERKQSEMMRFEREVANSQVIAITDADHWIFVSHPDEVLAAIVEFVDSL